MLNNEGLVILARAGYNERFIAELIKTQPSKFDTSVEGLVFLAKQGISERMVRMILAEQQRQHELKLAEQNAAAGPDDDLPAPRLKPQGFLTQPSPAAAKPVRLRLVNQKVLVPEKSGAIPADAMIVVERRALGDRYWALPPAAASSTVPTSNVVFR
jgi:hypothetical protein